MTETKINCNCNNYNNFYSSIICSIQEELKKLKNDDEIKSLFENLRKEYIKNLKDYKVKIDKIINYYENVILLNHNIESILIINAKVESNTRIICGTSENTFPIYEISIFFNTFWNSPYIPGSSIKGCIRASFKKSFKNDELIEKIFGSEKGVGSAIFLDAYPYIKAEKSDGNNQIMFKKTKDNEVILSDVIEGEVINKHIDDDTFFNEGEIIFPNPIIFLAVKPEVPFCFVILLKKGFKNNCKEYLLQAIVRAFEFEGIGSKTSIGYGRLKIEEILEVTRNETTR